jgi:RHS repeat-associated protein
LATKATDGTEASRRRFNAYGTVAAQATATGIKQPLLGYAGQYTDTETGYQYLRARYYDPGTGQFLTLDPLVRQTNEPFGYSRGNPQDGSDPSGLGEVVCPDGTTVNTKVSGCPSGGVWPPGYEINLDSTPPPDPYEPSAEEKWCYSNWLCSLYVSLAGVPTGAPQNGQDVAGDSVLAKSFHDIYQASSVAKPGIGFACGLAISGLTSAAQLYMARNLHGSTRDGSPLTNTPQGAPPSPPIIQAYPG